MFLRALGQIQDSREILLEVDVYRCDLALGFNFIRRRGIIRHHPSRKPHGDQMLWTCQQLCRSNLSSTDDLSPCTTSTRCYGLTDLALPPRKTQTPIYTSSPRFQDHLKVRTHVTNPPPRSTPSPIPVRSSLQSPLSARSRIT
jgi:hypothetical protein